MTLVSYEDQERARVAQRAEAESNRAYWTKRVRGLLERAPAWAASTRRMLRDELRTQLAKQPRDDPGYEQRVRAGIAERWDHYDDRVRELTGEAALLVGVGVMDPAAASLLVRSLERGEHREVQAPSVVNVTLPAQAAPVVNLNVEPARAEVRVENTIPERQTVVNAPVTVSTPERGPVKMSYDQMGRLDAIRPEDK